MEAERVSSTFDENERPTARKSRPQLDANATTRIERFELDAIINKGRSIPPVLAPDGATAADGAPQPSAPEASAQAASAQAASPSTASLPTTSAAASTTTRTRHVPAPVDARTMRVFMICVAIVAGLSALAGFLAGRIAH